MDEGWTGVRPFRFIDEIFAVTRLMEQRPEGISSQEIRNELLLFRMNRDERRRKAIQRTVSLRMKIRKRQVMLTKAEQFTRVLRATGLARGEKGIWFGTQLSHKLSELLKIDRWKASAFLLERLLTSSYQTYWLFLEKLFQVKRFVIPPEFVKRDQPLKTYLNTHGFPIDLWSFFIMRDLFYDFGLMNYLIDESGEHWFALYDISPESSSPSYRFSVRGQEGRYLHFWRNVSHEDFALGLVKVYLRLTDGHWNRIVDLIKLRELSSESLKISEQEFNQMLQEAVEKSSKYQIVLSAGALDMNGRSGYLIKALSLPTGRLRLPYRFARIDLRH